MIYNFESSEPQLVITPGTSTRVGLARELHFTNWRNIWRSLPVQRGWWEWDKEVPAGAENPVFMTMGRWLQVLAERNKTYLP